MKTREETVLATYTLQLIGPDREWNDVRGISPSLLREAEENMTDLLPEGYSVKIGEWDHE